MSVSAKHRNKNNKMSSQSSQPTAASSTMANESSSKSDIRKHGRTSGAIGEGSHLKKSTHNTIWGIPREISKRHPQIMSFSQKFYTLTTVHLSHPNPLFPFPNGTISSIHQDTVSRTTLWQTSGTLSNIRKLLHAIPLSLALPPCHQSTNLIFWSPVLNQIQRHPPSSLILPLPSIRLFFDLQLSSSTKLNNTTNSSEMTPITKIQTIYGSSYKTQSVSLVKTTCSSMNTVYIK